MFALDQTNNTPTSLNPQTLATVSFEGLGLFCINERKECELGVLDSAGHRRVLRILKNSIEINQQVLDLGDFIKIEVTNPVKNGVELYHNNNVRFERESDQGDPKDFRWMIDLESELYHGRSVVIDPGRSQLLHPIFFITSGLMYTLARDGEEHPSARVRWDDAAARRFTSHTPDRDDFRLVGKVGHMLGVDLLTENPADSKVMFSLVNEEGYAISGGPTFELEGGTDVKYEIIIGNVCPEEMDCGEMPEDETDFRFYYNVISDPDGMKFDLRFVKDIESIGEEGLGSFGGEVIPLRENAELGLDGCPQACHPSHMCYATALRRRSR